MIDTIIVSGGNIHSDFALDFLKKNEACLIAADKGLEKNFWKFRKKEVWTVKFPMVE